MLRFYSVYHLVIGLVAYPTMGHAIDLTGQQFGHWIVLKRGRNKGFGKQLKVRWLVQCSCGTRRLIVSEYLRKGDSTSCGCKTSEARSRSGSDHGFTSRLHGKRPHYLHGIWWTMIQRCHDPNSQRYPLYGARGIEVCPRWRTSFVAFLQDVGERPSPKHSLDRINNGGDYEPGNVRWATKKEQMRNMRTNVRFTVGEETLCIAEWAERWNVSRKVAKQRLIEIQSGSSSKLVS